jgi:hypothetical protein
VASAADQLGNLLGAASQFAQTAGNYYDNLRRQEADLVIQKKAPALRDALYGGMRAITASDASPGDYVRLWDKGADDQGNTLLSDLQKQVDDETNPYAKEALQKYLSDTNFQIRQHLVDNTDNYTKSKIVADGDTLIAKTRDDPTIPIAKRAAQIEQTLATMQSAMDPQAFAKYADSQRKVLTIDTLTEAGRAAMQQALDSGMNPLLAIRDVNAAVDAATKTNLTFGGETVAFTPELVASVKDGLANDLKGQYVINNEIRSADIQAHEDTINTNVFTRQWDSVAGLEVLKAGLMGKAGSTGNASKFVDAKTQAVIDEYQLKYGDNAKAMLAQVQSRIDYLLARESGASTAALDAEASTYLSEATLRYANHESKASIKAWIDSKVANPATSKAALNAWGDFNRSVSGELESDSNYLSGLSMVTSAFGKDPVKQKQAIAQYNATIERGVNGKQFGSQDYLTVAKEISNPVFEGNVAAALENWLSPTGDRAIYGSQEGADAWTRVVRGGDAGNQQQIRMTEASTLRDKLFLVKGLAGFRKDDFSLDGTSQYGIDFVDQKGNRITLSKDGNGNLTGTLLRAGSKKAESLGKIDLGATEGSVALAEKKEKGLSAGLAAAAAKTPAQMVATIAEAQKNGTDPNYVGTNDASSIDVRVAQIGATIVNAGATPADRAKKLAAMNPAGIPALRSELASYTPQASPAVVAYIKSLIDELEAAWPKGKK